MYHLDISECKMPLARYIPRCTLLITRRPSKPGQSFATRMLGFRLSKLWNLEPVRLQSIHSNFKESSRGEIMSQDPIQPPIETCEIVGRASLHETKGSLGEDKFKWPMLLLRKKNHSVCFMHSMDAVCWHRQ